MVDSARVAQFTLRVRALISVRAAGNAVPVASTLTNTLFLGSGRGSLGTLLETREG